MTGMKDEIVKTTVDKDILDFLKAVYFGDFTDPIKAASGRAYRDMNRTIRFNGLPDKERLELKEKATGVLEAEISKLTGDSITSRDMFDFWHHGVCYSIRALYKNKGIEFTYGQAQKWLNMTIKYLYTLEVYSFENVFEYLHIPIDINILKIARDSLGIEEPRTAWSTWDDYENQYLHYQNLLRERIVSETPLRWEFGNWSRQNSQ